MAASKFSALFLFFIFFIIFSISSCLSLADELKGIKREKQQVGVGLMGRRGLKSFKESVNGGNVTYECAVSGPCVPCAYSEKSDEKYRCSETGYRIPLKCVKARGSVKEATSEKSQKGAEQPRSLLDDSSSSDDNTQSYVTYRSCIPPANEEKLSVLGFEGVVMGLLLLSGSVIYYRRKRTSVAPGVGPVRVPSSSRF